MLSKFISEPSIGGTHRERLRELRERGGNNREVSPLPIFETTEPNSSWKGIDSLTWEMNSCQELPKKNTCHERQTEAQWDGQWRVQ